MSESYWSREHNKWVRACSRCDVVFIGAEDYKESLTIFSIDFGTDNSDPEELNVRCRICVCLGKNYKGHRLEFNGEPITSAHIRQLLVEQGNKCAICDTEISFGTTQFRAVPTARIDHDHITGDIKGILCNNCNIHLPIIENQEWRTKAEAYLDRHRNRPKPLVEYPGIKTRKCPNCGIEFATHNPKKMFCSKHCCSTHWNKADRAYWSKHIEAK